jgi:hypothetical protein
MGVVQAGHGPMILGLEVETQTTISPSPFFGRSPSVNNWTSYEINRAELNKKKSLVILDLQTKISESHWSFLNKM